MKKLFLLLLPLTLIACAKPDASNLEEIKNREIEVENANLKKKSALLQDDLEKRQRLFSALKGTFEGTFVTNNKEFLARMTLVPSLPPYDSGRARTLEEITADLNNLYFTVQVTLLNVQTENVVSGCIFSQVRPDYDAGAVNAASETCSNIFFVSLYDSYNSPSSPPFQKPNLQAKSHDLAQRVFAKQIFTINEIFVEMSPTMSSKSFQMLLKRIP